MNTNRLANGSGPLGPRLLLTGGAVLAGVLARQATKKSWELVMDEPPPLNPAARHVGWRDAVAFTVGTAVFVGLARLVVRRELTRRLYPFS